MSSYSPIEPVGLNRVQTAQAVAGEVGGETSVPVDVGCEEGEAGRLGHRTAVKGKGRTWVSAAQNKSEVPEKRWKETIQ